MNIFNAVLIYTKKYKYYLTIRLTLTILTSFVAIIAPGVVPLEEQAVRLKWLIPWRWVFLSERKVAAAMPLCVVKVLAESARNFEALVEPPTCPLPRWSHPLAHPRSWWPRPSPNGLKKLYMAVAVTKWKKLRRLYLVGATTANHRPEVSATATLARGRA